MSMRQTLEEAARYAQTGRWGHRVRIEILSIGIEVSVMRRDKGQQNAVRRVVSWDEVEHGKANFLVLTIDEMHRSLEEHVGKRLKEEVMKTLRELRGVVG